METYAIYAGTTLPLSLLVFAGSYFGIWKRATIMNKDRSGWIAGGLLLAVVAILYAFNSYNELFTRRVAYLYDSASDDVFSIQMAPWLNRYQKWEPLVPFKSLRYVEPDGADYIGKLDSTIAEYRADMELLRSDIDAWNEKHDRELEGRLSALSSNGTEMEFWDVEYYPRPDEGMRSLMSTTLSDLLKGLENPSEVMVVDAVIAHSVVSSDGSSDERTSIRIVRDALLLKGSAAYALAEQGLR